MITRPVLWKYFFNGKGFVYYSLLLLVLILPSCDSKNKRSADIEMEKGALLATLRCTSCHALPDPNQLPKATWEKYVLPRMGYMMGIYEPLTTRDSLLERGLAGELVRRANIYPEQPQISAEDWAAIQAFYLDSAPVQLEVREKTSIEKKLPLFKAHFSEIRLSPPSSTMVKIKRDGGFFVGDANTQGLYQFGGNHQLQHMAKVLEGAVHVDELPNNFLVTVMGSFSPTDAQKGVLMALPKDRNASPSLLINQLQRPVHTAVADLDKDKKPDFVIAEFAKWTGKLAHWTLENGKFKPTILRNKPGAIRSVITDLDQDGREDVIALFGQGAEGVFAFFNKGEGVFEEKSLIEFPATYGSSYFDLIDLDNDEDFDIVYTNGDNADYPPVLKPYHGIRFFTNDGKNNFEESFFYPLNGAYKAIPADFDADGDYDIAAISFFPDFQNSPEEGFIFLENTGSGQLKARTFPEVNSGRWISMDAGDVDLDGDTDLILGSLAFEVVPPTGLLTQWVEEGNPFVILENQLK